MAVYEALRGAERALYYELLDHYPREDVEALKRAIDRRPSGMEEV